MAANKKKENQPTPVQMMYKTPDGIGMMEFDDKLHAKIAQETLNEWYGMRVQTKFIYPEG